MSECLYVCIVYLQAVIHFEFQELVSLSSQFLVLLPIYRTLLLGPRYRVSNPENVRARLAQTLQLANLVTSMQRRDSFPQLHLQHTLVIAPPSLQTVVVSALAVRAQIVIINNAAGCGGFRASTGCGVGELARVDVAHGGWAQAAVGTVVRAHVFWRRLLATSKARL